MVRSSIFAACLIAAGFASPSAHAASFNCNLVTKPDEVLICQQPELSSLDEQMAALYDVLRNNLVGRARQTLISDQVRWLQGRFGCGYDYGCIRSAYLRRIAQLRSY